MTTDTEKNSVIHGDILEKSSFYLIGKPNRNECIYLYILPTKVKTSSDKQFKQI